MKTLINQADEFYWAHASDYPDLDGEQIKNEVHRDMIRLAADFAKAYLAGHAATKVQR